MSRKGALPRGLAVAAAAIVGLALAGSPAAANDPDGSGGAEGPIVIAHRGASGYLPEHTLEAYDLAVALGADVIEPDLVLTADGELLARHEPMLGETTDVADRPEFADRKTTKDVDGAPVTDWFAEDFTLEELRTLRAVERIPDLRPHSAVWDGKFELVTFEEVLDYADALAEEIVVYPEMKHPSFYGDQGLSIEDALADVLAERGLDRADAPVWVQSFEYPSLVEIGERIGNPLGYNIAGSGEITDDELDSYADTLDTVSLNKERIYPLDDDGNLTGPADVVERAHDRGLDVHVWTFRNENAFLPADLRGPGGDAAWGDFDAEYQLFYDLGVDAVFSDHPDKAVAARER